MSLTSTAGPALGDVLILYQMSPTCREPMQTSVDNLLRDTADKGAKRFPWCSPKGVSDAVKSRRCYRKAGMEECEVTGEARGLSMG